VQQELANSWRRHLRWRILRTLYAGLPYPINEALLVDVLDDTDLRATSTEVQGNLRYLADKGYCEVKEAEEGKLEARLLARGVDFVEYSTRDEDPGIARPAQR
jgi:hypothetical protein